MRHGASKYGNKPVVIDGIRFASGREGRRYSTLKLLERAGEIQGLTLQPRYPIKINDVLVCTYLADFAYRDKSGELVVEDAKGFRTDVYRLKKKMVEAAYGIKIREV